jgi:hypothetical protein
MGSKFDKIVFIIVFIGLFVSIGFNVYYKRAFDSIPTESYIDTIPFYYPVPKDSLVIRYVTQTLPVVPPTEPVKPSTDTAATLPVIDSTATHSQDSAQVIIPITQKYYKEENYEAWVSGYMPKLDSCRVFAPTNVIKPTSKDPFFDISVGLQIGFGYAGQNNYVPYVGVGVTFGVPLRKIIKK